MNLDQEIRRLIEIMPASGRMFTKIISKPQQSQVIDAPFPLPWNQASRHIYINFDLWSRLSPSERDLLLLRAVSSVIGVKWLKPDVFQVMTLAGLVGLTTEALQADAIGIIVGGGLTAIAATQIWRNNQSTAKELEADEKAVKIASRRGYTEVEAARQLLSAIESVADIETRPSLNFMELIRCQNLRAMANISPVGVPETIRKQ